MKQQNIIMMVGLLMLSAYSASSEQMHEQGDAIALSSNTDSLIQNNVTESDETHVAECICSLCTGSTAQSIKNTIVNVFDGIRLGACACASFLDASLEVLGGENDTPVCNRKTRIAAVRKIISRSVDAALLVGMIGGGVQCGHAIQCPHEARILHINCIGNDIGTQRFVYGGISVLCACLFLVKQ